MFLLINDVSVRVPPLGRGCPRPPTGMTGGRSASQTSPHHISEGVRQQQSGLSRPQTQLFETADGLHHRSGDAIHPQTLGLGNT